MYLKNSINNNENFNKTFFKEIICSFPIIIMIELKIINKE